MKIFNYFIALGLSLMISGGCFAEWQVVWEKQLSGAIVGNVTRMNDMLIVTSGKQITALTIEGKNLWQTTLPGEIRSAATVEDNAVYVNCDVGLFRLDRVGEIQWHFVTKDDKRQIPGTSYGWGDEMFDDVWALYRSAPAVDEGSVYVGNINGATAVDKKTGKLKWHQNEVGSTHTTPMIFEDKVIFADWENNLTALERESGNVSWVYEAKLPGGKWADWHGWIGLHLSPIIIDKQILVGSRGTYFYNIDAATGKANWSWKHPSSWVGSSAIAIDNDVYFAMSDGMTVHGMNIRSGNQTLLYNAGFSGFATPARFGNSLLVGTMSGQLHAINLNTKQGNVVFSTKACQKQCGKYVLESGGLNYAAIQPDNTAAGMAKIVDTMLEQLNSILSVSVVGDFVLLGTANGRLIALRNPSS